MGFRPPPPPISVEEFRRRYQAGARTMEELDPDLAAWIAHNERESRLMKRLMILYLILALATLLMGGHPTMNANDPAAKKVESPLARFWHCLGTTLDGLPVWVPSTPVRSRNGDSGDMSDYYPPEPVKFIPIVFDPSDFEMIATQEMKHRFRRELTEAEEAELVRLGALFEAQAAKREPKPETQTQTWRDRPPLL